MWIFLLIPAISTAFSFLLAEELVPKLREQGINGEDKHKASGPKVPEMGGLVLVGGFVFGLLAAVGFNQFADRLNVVDLNSLFAVGFTVLIVAIIGMVDDLLRIRQLTKAVLPFLASLPLMAIKAGKHSMNFPFLGQVQLGLLYPLLAVPFGITGAANAMNMLAGFNGLEVGLGVIIVSALAFISWLFESWTAFFVLISLLGPLLVVLFYNWYPADLLIGDVGTLTIGAVVASAVIVGDFEYAGVIIIIPFVADLVLKAMNGFPKSFAVHEDGKLYCPEDGPDGLAHLVLKLAGGLTEQSLVLVLLGIEGVFALLAVVYYI